MKIRINIWLDYYIIIKLLIKPPILSNLTGFWQCICYFQGCNFDNMDIPSHFLSLGNTLSRLGMSGSFFCKDVLLQQLGRIRGTSLFLKGCSSILPILYQHFHRNARPQGPSISRELSRRIFIDGGFIDDMICNESKQQMFLHINIMETGFSFYIGASR